MKKGILLVFVAIFSIAIIWLMPTENTHANILQPPGGFTGAPGEQTCNSSGCHVGNAVITNDPIAVLASAGGTSLSTGYTAGTIYNITLNADPTANRAGFELTALDAAGNAAGTLALSGATSTNTAIQTVGGRQYISHKNANSTISWAFKWTAPATTTGDVFFYLAVNIANNDGTNGGDQIKTKAYKVSPTTGLTAINYTGINELQNADDAGIKVYPNPVKDQLNMSFAAPENERVVADVYDLNGKLVMPLMNEQGNGHTTKSFDMDGSLSNGVYIIRMSVGTNNYFKKIMVQQ